jgi:hypothetical protein
VVRYRHTHEEEGWPTSEISREQEYGGSADNRDRKTVYETPVLKRLGSIAEVTQGAGGPKRTDVANLSIL